ncbi:hypothetical protein [Nostoc sp.]|uniref:hypothetical protein n=1 Tax=Nostoc sp. TaxID=1180 RepID=UPI002FF6FFF5
MNRRLYNNQSFVETAIYRVFAIIYRVFVIYNFHQKTLTDGKSLSSFCQNHL